MAGHHRLQHRLLGELLGLQFDHQHRVRRAGDDEIEGGIFHLLDCRIDLDLALDESHSSRADRAHERHPGKGQRRRGGDHRQNVRVGLQVVGEDRGDDLRVATEVLGKQRSDRPVDQAGGQRFAIRGAPFALEITAGNSPRRECLFLVVDGQGKKVLARLRLLGGDDRRQHRGFAPGGEHRAIGLTSQAACFKRELAPAPVEFFALYIKHLSSSCMS